MNFKYLDDDPIDYVPSFVKPDLIPFQENEEVYCPYFLEGIKFIIQKNELLSENYEPYYTLICQQLYIEHKDEKLYFDEYGLHDKYGFVIFKVNNDTKQALNILYPSINFE